MPQLTPEQEDAIFGAISKQLRNVNMIVKGMFGQDLSDEELRRAYQGVKQGVQQAIQQQEQGNQALPGGGRSRVAGDVRPAMSDSLINNLPAQPGDQQLQHPMLGGRPPMFPQAT